MVLGGERGRRRDARRRRERNGEGKMKSEGPRNASKSRTRRRKQSKAADAQAGPLEPPHPLYAMEGASQFTPDIGNTTATTANNKGGKTSQSGTSSKKPSPTRLLRSLQAALGNFKRELTADAESLSASVSQTVSHTLQGIDTLGSSALERVGLGGRPAAARSRRRRVWRARRGHAGHDERGGRPAGEPGRTELGEGQLGIESVLVCGGR